ncbi:o-succinylbenzoate synthase [Geosporobacter ferrireducens]|uniref:o-succinylbenzoate synthase n=1 Tax=Geosporobacter ferrireducens TaxID=1424294 RepID=A0A1D8GME6_9FIRM|nr:o-succinylbenzoate synthase [Geosporobacter ferrireducens]AOT72067.1 o-succinylbenzoate synthase [Geosporobacter ferrireducens]MTI55952.1 o-succinylbenzoate synthase [Geosporobacter ferrireducens]
MRIDRIDVIRVKNPFLHPFETSFARFVERDALIVKIYSEGLVGYGECKAFHAPLYNAEDNVTCHHIIKDLLVPILLHKDIEGPEEFMRKISFIRGNRLAIASVENALWDLKTQREGKSLKTLIGGTYNEIKVGVSLGIEPTITALLQKIEKYLLEGYHRTKIKIKPGWDIEVLKEVRKNFPDITLTIDANSAYSLDDIELFKAMDDFNLSYIEQPLAENDIVDHAVLQKAIKTPICLDESITSVEDARRAIALGSCKIINIKSSRVGGIYESVKIHDLCMKHDIPVWCGGMLELGIGRVQNISLASLPNFTLAHDIAASKRYYTEDVTIPYVDITKDCTIIVPDETNGVCYTVDEASLDRLMVSRDVFK